MDGIGKDPSGLFCIKEGVLIKFQGKDFAGTAEIPFGVTVIGEGAFADSDLTGVSIPQSVVRIERGAFRGCEDLGDVVLPEGLLYLGDEAFLGCDGLYSIAIPDSVTEIGCDVFSWCMSLKEVRLGKGLKKIPNAAFFNTALISIEIPDGIAEIGDHAFGLAWQLAEVDLGRGVSRLGERVFLGCDHLRRISVPADNPVFYSAGNCLIERATGKVFVGTAESVIPADGSVVEIGEDAFSSRARVAELPAGIKKIGARAFIASAALESVVLPEGTLFLGEGAFANCKNLKRVLLPASLKRVEKDVFQNCPKLTIVIDEGTMSEGWDPDWNPDRRPVVRKGA